MNSPPLVQMRDDGASCTNLIGIDEIPQSLPKAPRGDGTPVSDHRDGPGMRFAFLIHPLSEQTKDLMALDRDGRLRKDLGPGRPARVLLRGTCRLRGPLAGRCPDGRSRGPRIVDTFDGLVSAAGARAEGRLYEIPMDARAILDDPDQALELMEQAVEDAIGWGARIVGLGSMTGIVGNHGEFLAERHPIAVTTGNSLTVYATVRNLEHYCEASRDRPGRRGDRGRGDPGQHRDGRGRAAGAAVPAPGPGGKADFIPGDPPGRTGWVRGWRWISPKPSPRPRSW